MEDDFSVRMHAEWNGEPYEFLISKKYDHLVHSRKYGAWLLKVVDPQLGFVQMAMSEEEALKVKVVAKLRLAYAEGETELSTSELEFWRNAQANNLEDLFGEDFPAEE